MSSDEYRQQRERLEQLRQAYQGDGQQLGDPLIGDIPDVYAPSGFDVMDILMQVYNRPKPHQIEIGNVDSAVALVLCDAETSDHSILYCSEPFQILTGYSSSEVLGQNCRFLQHPPGRKCPDRSINHTNSSARQEVKYNMSRWQESQVRFVNFKKDGSPFMNLLTLIPINWQGKNYIVGFQADEGSIRR